MQLLGGHSNDKVQQDIRDNKIKEGMLSKQSRHLKQWKDRWMVLTKTYMYSFQSKTIYRNPTEVIALKDVETTKVYYKDQIQSKDVNLHMAAKTADEKWAWMTAIEKMIERVVHPDIKPDTHNLIRETIRMSTAIRNTLMKKQAEKQKSNGNVDEMMKKINIALNSKIVDYSYQPENFPNRGTIEQETFFKIQKIQKNIEEGKTKAVVQKKQKIQQKEAPVKIQQKIIERIVEVQKIVYKEIKVPQIREKIVEKIVEKIIEKPIYIDKKEGTKSISNSHNNSIEKLLTHLMQSPHQNPKPIMDFAIYLQTQGPQQYYEEILQFCLKGAEKRLFSEYLILLINQCTCFRLQGLEIDESRLNSYLRFMITIYENSGNEYFYSTDYKAFVDILIRDMQMNRSQFNQYLIMMVMKTMAEKDWWLTINYRRNDIKTLVKQLERVSNSENQFLASELLIKL